MPKSKPVSSVQKPDAEEQPPHFTAVDLFCGIGGFHIAASDVEIETIFACDIDRAASECYSFNLGLEPHDDVRDCKGDIPEHDILMAGFPCQPFSIIGKGHGLEDPRGSLIYRVVEIAASKRPQAILLENVKRLTTHNGGQTIRKIRKLFEDIGYYVEYQVLDALNFGIPQRRERTFVVALKAGYPPINWPMQQEPYRPLREVLEADVDTRYFANQQIRDNRRAKHTSKIDPPAIWHQNVSDVIRSYPFAAALRSDASYNYQLVNGERRFTEREMLRLQGFPEWFQPTGSYQQTRRQTGNAVPVPMARAVLQSIKHIIRSE